MAAPPTVQPAREEARWRAAAVREIARVTDVTLQRGRIDARDLAVGRSAIGTTALAADGFVEHIPGRRGVLLKSLDGCIVWADAVAETLDAEETPARASERRHDDREEDPTSPHDGNIPSLIESLPA
jgi:hypothetical protein